MTNPQDTLPGLQWHEPIEGLEFGEIFLGGVASTYFGRGRSFGYAVYFTDRRIIGVRMRLLAQVLQAPYLVVVLSLYLLAFFNIGSRELVFIILPFVLFGADQGLRIVSRRFSERIVSRKGEDTTMLTSRKRDFEFRREEIGEFLMQSPGRGLLDLGLSKGYLRITPKNHLVRPAEIKLYRWNRSQKLRDEVIKFSSREPKIRAMEYPWV